MKQAIFALALVTLIGFSGQALADDYDDNYEGDYSVNYDGNYEGNYPQFPDWADRVFTEADEVG